MKKNGITHVRAVLACRRAGGQAFGRAEHATRVACAGRAEYLFLLIKPFDITATKLVFSAALAINFSKCLISLQTRNHSICNLNSQNSSSGATTEFRATQCQ